MENVPFRPPRRLSAQNTPKVWRVMGIEPMGNDIHEHTAITAANMAISTSSLVENLFDFLFNTVESFIVRTPLLDFSIL